MKKTICVVIVAFLLVASAKVSMASTPEDFVAPTDGGTTAVSGLVREGEGGILEAQSAQDGFNYGSQVIHSLGGGFRQVTFGSGLGYVAGATERYEVFENPNATQQSLRLAYVRAYTRAKAELTRGLRGVSGRGKELLNEQLTNIDTASGSASNLSSYYEEKLEQVVEGLLRGYVVYEVSHDLDAQEIYVSIATSPKTLSAICQVSGAIIQSASLEEGLDYVFKEVTRGIIPPVGGKIVSVPTTGEVAVVSFGSDILRDHENPAMVRALQQASERAATMRANDAMIGILHGDEIMWRSGLRTSTEYSQKEYLEIVDEDLNTHYELLGDLQSEFFGMMELNEDYAVFRSGRMPAGISTQLVTDNYWVYAINVYLPNISDQTRDFYGLIQNLGSTSRESDDQKQNILIDKKYEADQHNSPVQKGPDGEVSSSDDL